MKTRVCPDCGKQWKFHTIDLGGSWKKQLAWVCPSDVSVDKDRKK